MLKMTVDVGEGAELDAYVLEFRAAARRPAIIICPGGGYLKLAQHEGEPVAARFLGLGYSVFLLRYSTYVTAPSESGQSVYEVHENAMWPLQVVQIMSAMAYVRCNAEAFGVDPSAVYCLGFSAGAHVVCSLAERWDDEALLAQARISSPSEVKPTGILLCYPALSASYALRFADRSDADSTLALLGVRALFRDGVIDEERIAELNLVEHVRSDMPRCFIWHTAEDGTTPPAETLAFASGLLRLGVPCELHMYQNGRHGMALCDAASASEAWQIDSAAAAWVAAADAWMRLDSAER